MNQPAAGDRSREVAPDLGVVVIGASLGGFDAMRLLLGRLPASFPAPIVLVQHRMSDSDGLLVELLGAESLLPVSEPEDKDLIVPGHVYLAPSDYHLFVERGFFSLSTDDPVCYARPSIDVLFQSAADSYGPSVVGVLLTGSNRDGANGIRAVKKAGGRVLVQDPRTAVSPIAPKAAMECTVVDSVLALPRIAERLAQMFASPGSAAE